MNYLSSPDFNAQKMCGSLCLQHKVNEALDAHVKGELSIYDEKTEGITEHINFI
jgi:hypothetical protein